jgi:hypothetical protein
MDSAALEENPCLAHFAPSPLIALWPRILWHSLFAMVILSAKDTLSLFHVGIFSEA